MPILTKQQLEALNQSSFPDQSTEAITPQILREYNTATIDTLVDSLDTGSFTTDITDLNAFTESVDEKFDTLGLQSGSYLVTASFNNGTRNLTFTKEDDSTFNVNIPDTSGSSAGFPYVGDAQITGSLEVSETIKSQIFYNPQTISGSITIPTNNNAMVVGPISIDGAIVLEGNSKLIVLDQITGSNTPIDTGSFATTGSNVFIGDQQFTGSFNISSSVDRVNLVGPNISNFGQSDIGGVYVPNSFSVGGDMRISGAVRFNQLDVNKIVKGQGGSISQLAIISDTLLYNDSDINVPKMFGVSGSIFVSQSINVGTAVKLKGNDPLPAGSIGDLAVSGSNLYFYNGAWTLVV